jgi:peptidyl-prolyl cis-trans isomerase C
MSEPENGRLQRHLATSCDQGPTVVDRHTMSLRTAISIAFVFVALTGCGDSQKNGQPDAGTPPLGLTPEQAGRVVARVDDQTITLGDFAETLDRMDPFDRLRYQTVEKRRDLLTEMVDLELLAIEARRRGLDKTPEAEESVRQVLRDAVLVEARKSLPTPTEIPMEEVRAYYEERKAEYQEPERRRVSAILLDDEKKAKEVLESAQKIGADATAWGKLFFESSTTAAQDKKGNIPADLAGDLGIVGPPGDQKGANVKVPEPVRAAAFKLGKVGDVYAEVIPHEGKFYVICLAGMTAGHERSLAEAERQIRVELLKQKMKKLEDDLVAELRKKHKVEIDEAALAKVGAAPAP